MQGLGRVTEGHSSCEACDPGADRLSVGEHVG